MRTSITHLPAQIQADLTYITEFLLQQTPVTSNKASRIHYLILHGCFTEEDWQPETEVCPEGPYRYNLLVLITKNRPEILPVLQKAVEQLNQSGKVTFPISIEVDTHKRLNQRLMDGYLTYDRIQDRGILLYSRGTRQSNLFSSPKQHTAAEHYVQAQKHFDYGFPLTKSFLTGAYFFKHKSRKAAAFLLNISATQAYVAFLAVHTLKHSERRRIHDLRALAESIHPDLKALWSSPQAQSCFDWLKRAFSGGRFGKDYGITYDQMDLMFGYVEDLHERIKHICQIKLDALKVGNFDKPELLSPDTLEKDTLKKLSRLIFKMEEPCYELEGIAEVIRDISHNGEEEHLGIHFIGRSLGDRATLVKETFRKATSLLRKHHLRTQATPDKKL